MLVVDGSENDAVKIRREGVKPTMLKTIAAAFGMLAHEAT